MSEIIDLTKWLKAQTDKFETKKRLLLFTDIIHTPSGEKVKEGFRYFHADADELLAAFDADDVEAITRLPYALDAEGEIDTSGLCLKLAYTPGSAFLAAQPQQYQEYVPTDLREPKYLTIPAGFDITALDQSS